VPEGIADNPGCLNFQALSPQEFRGPTFRVGPLDFTNPTDPTSGLPIPITLEKRPEDKDGLPELYVGFSQDTGGYQPLLVDLPQARFPKGVKEVSVELRHFNKASIRALDGQGRVLDEVTQPGQGTRVVLPLRGPDIRRLQFNVVETLVYKICWAP
jgi:hypothetical protein